MAGAILVGDNYLRRPDFAGTTGIGTGWTNLDQLAVHTLEPKAEYEAQAGTVGIEISSNGSPEPLPDSAVLLGLEIGDSPEALDSFVAVVDYWNGSSWLSTTVSAYQIQAPSGRHVVLTGLPTDPAIVAGGWRIRWAGNNTAGRLGGVYLGRSTQALELADAHWVSRFADTGKQERSQGGQIFTDRPNVSRQLRLRQGTLPSVFALGVVPHGDTVEVGAPSLIDDATYDSGTRFLTIGDGSSGDGAWGSLVPPGFSRLDYTQEHELLATASAPSEPRWQLAPEAWTDVKMVNRSGLADGRGTMILYNSTASAATLYLEGAHAGGTARIRVDKLSAIEGEITHTWDWSGGLSTNIVSLLMTHGASHPIIAMPYPSDPARNAAVGIYGLLKLPVDLRDQDGEIYASELVIDEQR